MKFTIYLPALAAIFLCLSVSNSVFGQQAFDQEKGKQLAEKLLEAHKSEFTPLQQKSTEISNLFYAKQSGQTAIAKAIKEADGSSLEKIQKEIEKAKLKLESLEQIEKHLGEIAKDESLKAGFIKTAEENIEKIKLERTAAYKPVNDMRAEAYKKHKDDAEEFAEIVKLCMKPKGEHELTKGADLKYNSFDSGSAKTSTSFYDEHGQKISINISLIQANKPTKKLGNFLGKYPLARKDSWGGYTFHIGSVEAKVTSRIKEWSQKQMEEAIDDLIDFEKLELLTSKSK